MLGETIGHYRLLEKLGAGSMGEVYLAEDLRLHRRVALKTLPADAAGDAAATAAATAWLVREARVASALSHPNIAVVHDIGEAERDGRRFAFIAMEYVAGRTLGEIARERRLAAKEALALVRQVAEALAEAHERGVVHRDIKPGNVMVTDKGLVKVLDFGLAKYAPPGVDATATWSGQHRQLGGAGALMGTLAYMSPEQVRGAEVDARSDIFSLGVLLYELLSGHRPHEGENAVALIDSILHEAPPPLGPPVAPEILRVVLRMLEKERGRRHPDMAAVCRDLAALIAGRGAEAGLLEPASPTVAVMSFTNITGSLEDDWLGIGIAETLSVGLSGVSTLQVLSRERVADVLRKLGGPGADEQVLARRLGRELGARLVVGGGYQRQGEHVRVTARVTETDTGTVSLTLKLDGRMAEIFTVQDRIVGEISAGLQRRLPAAAAGSPEPEDTHSLAAYEAYAKGLINLRTESPEALDRAILFFERAVGLDPGYARAHLQLGSAYDVKGDYLSMPELQARALECLDRAIALRPGLTEAHRVRASTLLVLGREAEAQAAVERALALDPGDAASHSTEGRIHFICRGDFPRAAACYERALALNPQSGWAALQLAHCAALLGEFQRAEAAAWRAVVLQEEFLSGREGLLIVGAYVRLAQIFARQGRHAEAVHQLERELDFLRRVDHALRPRIFIELHQRMGESKLALGDASGGRAALDLALEAFARRLRNGADDPATRYYAACAYALRGDREAALESLEKAASLRRPLTLGRARREPALGSLSGEERFLALLAEAPATRG